MARWLGPFVALCFALPSCGGDEPCAQCPPDGGIGVPLAPVCDGVACADGVACTTTAIAHDDAELSSLVAGAAAGSCIVVAPGSYGDLVLPAGVSLLGRWADEVTVGAVNASSGGDRVIRGLTATTIAIGAGEASVDQVRLTGGAVGIDVGEGAAVTVSRSEATAATTYGLFAEKASSVAVVGSYFHDLGGPAIWVSCAEGCDCPSPPALSLESTVVERARHVGVNLVGVGGSVEGLTITDVIQLGGVPGGGGLAVSGCSDVDVAGLHVENTESFGLLVQSSSGTFGHEEAGIIVINGNVGIWLAPDVGQSVTLDGFLVSGSQGVGIGLGVDAAGIIVINGRVENTQLLNMPVIGGGQDQVGDGILWQTGASALIENVTLASNARNALLIDGSVGAQSAITNAILEGGDETKGIVQQGFTEGSVAPATTGVVLDQQEAVVFSVPEAPAAP